MQTKDSFYNIAKELEVAQENEGYLIVIRCWSFLHIYWSKCNSTLK